MDKLLASVATWGPGGRGVLTSLLVSVWQFAGRQVKCGVYFVCWFRPTPFLAYEGCTRRQTLKGEYDLAVKVYIDL